MRRLHWPRSPASGTRRPVLRGVTRESVPPVCRGRPGPCLRGHHGKQWRHLRLVRPVGNDVAEGGSHTQACPVPGGLRWLGGWGRPLSKPVGAPRPGRAQDPLFLGSAPNPPPEPAGPHLSGLVICSPGGGRPSEGLGRRTGDRAETGRRSSPYGDLLPSQGRRRVRRRPAAGTAPASARLAASGSFVLSLSSLPS